MSNPKTVRVRIAVGVSGEGVVSVPSQHPHPHPYGGGAWRKFMPDEYTLVWVEADVPLPTEAVVEGKVVGGDKSCG